MESKPRIADAATELLPSSAALKRLIDEVALGTASMIQGYNRTHNRHNR